MQSSGKYEALPVSPEVLRSVWPIVGPLLSLPVDQSQDRISTDDVLHAALAHEYLVWIVKSPNNGIVAAFTTRILTYPKRLALAVDFVGGSEMQGWLATVDEAIEAHASRCNCDLIEGYGRPAWGRVLGRYGWKPAYTTYHKDLRRNEQRRNEDKDD